MEIKSNKMAILIDGDNARSKLIKPILEEVSKYGKVTIRRIYGDWTSPSMNSWKTILNELSFTPIQKFSYTKGKNSTDSSLIIDAMDILHDGVVDGFCIVSSDSDYTGLAKRIREEGVFVMGIGEKKTPTAFVHSCELFTYCETIEPGRSQPETKASAGNKAKNNDKKTAIDRSLIDKAFDMSVNDDDTAFISLIGTNLRKLDPSFDSRTYGFRNLTLLFKSLENYEVSTNESNNVIVRRKN
jgi:uncharacterized LabA/DUF88 family protein